MPLTAKGREIKSNMAKEYGEKKGEQVFYASKNKGTIKGVDEAADDKRVMFLGRMRDALYEGHGLQSAMRKATGDTLLASFRDALDAGRKPAMALRDAWHDVRDYAAHLSRDAVPGARNIGRGIAGENAKARAHGIKPGHTIATSRGQEQVSHVSGNTLRTTSGNMYHATKVRPTGASKPQGDAEKQSVAGTTGYLIGSGIRKTVGAIGKGAEGVAEGLIE